MKKILLIDDSDTYTWCLQKILTAPGLPGENGLYTERSSGRHPRGNAAGGLL